jgi:hypothetical protein
VDSNQTSEDAEGWLYTWFRGLVEASSYSKEKKKCASLTRKCTSKIIHWVNVSSHTHLYLLSSLSFTQSFKAYSFSLFTWILLKHMIVSYSVLEVSYEGTKNDQSSEAYNLPRAPWIAWFSKKKDVCCSNVIWDILGEFSLASSLTGRGSNPNISSSFDVVNKKILGFSWNNNCASLVKWH